MVADADDDDLAFVSLTPDAARKLARNIVEHGVVTISPHAQEEMKNDDLITADCLNLLRAGTWQPPELTNNELRYRVQTKRMCFVVVFQSPHRLRVVTGWRNR